MATLITNRSFKNEQGMISVQKNQKTEKIDRKLKIKQHIEQKKGEQIKYR